jgi:tRNA threonylcarbamoyladenosine dehydratase
MADQEDELRLERIRLLLGDEAVLRLKSLRVTIFGLGAVGSFATEALARSGVGNFKLVDFDKVSKTNFNRNLFAIDENLGSPKVEVAAKRILSINPGARVEPVVDFFHAETADRLLEPGPDFLLDAIDSVGPKTELLFQCHKRGIPVISIMGAASRTDPTCVTISDISNTCECPLTKDIRKNLRALGVSSGIAVVYSTEKPAGSFDPESLDENSIEAYYSRGRKRKILPSMCTLPGIFGLIAANYIILKVAGREDPFSRKDSKERRTARRS